MKRTTESILLEITKLSVITSDDERRMKELVAELFHPELLSQLAEFLASKPKLKKIPKKTFPKKLPLSIEKFEADGKPYYVIIIKTLGRGGNGTVKLGLELHWNEHKQLIFGDLTAVKSALTLSSKIFKTHVESAKRFLQGKGTLERFKATSSPKKSEPTLKISASLKPEHHTAHSVQPRAESTPVNAEVTAEKKRYFTMAYIPGEPLQNITASTKYNLFDRFIICALSAYELKTKLHDKRVLNRDFKVQNIIYNHEKRKITLVDSDSHGMKDEKEIYVIGTPDYMPGEIIAYPHYTYESDIYSLGIAAAVVLSSSPLGKELLSHNHLLYAKTRARSDNLKKPYTTQITQCSLADLRWAVLDKALEKSNFSTSVTDYLKMMLDKDPGNRPKLEDIIKFFVENAITFYRLNHKEKFYDSVVNDPIETSLSKLEKLYSLLPPQLKPYVPPHYFEQQLRLEQIRETSDESVKGKMINRLFKREIVIENYYKLHSTLFKLSQSIEFLASLENQNEEVTKKRIHLCEILTLFHAELIKKTLTQHLDEAAVDDTHESLSSFLKRIRQISVDLEKINTQLESSSKCIEECLPILNLSDDDQCQLRAMKEISGYIQALVRAKAQPRKIETENLPDYKIMYGYAKQEVKLTFHYLHLYASQFPRDDQTITAMTAYLKKLWVELEELKTLESEEPISQRATQVAIQCHNLQKVILTVTDPTISPEEKKSFVQKYKESSDQFSDETKNLIIKIAAYILTALTGICLLIVHWKFKKEKEEVQAFSNVVENLGKALIP